MSLANAVGIHWIRKFDSFPFRINLRGGTPGNFVANLNFAAFIKEKSEMLIPAFPTINKKMKL